jgi:hypothetical protein
LAQRQQQLQWQVYQDEEEVRWQKLGRHRNTPNNPQPEPVECSTLNNNNYMQHTKDYGMDTMGLFYSTLVGMHQRDLAVVEKNQGKSRRRLHNGTASKNGTPNARVYHRRSQDGQSVIGIMKKSRRCKY